MKKLLFMALMFVAVDARSAWVGKLDLNSSVQPLLLRELNDGQYLAGLSHPNLWHLDHNDNPIFHVGIFQAWNSQNGNASFGPIAGIDLTGISKEAGIDIPEVIGATGNALHAPTLFKPAKFIASLTSVDAFVGYRPIHTSDVNGELVYGVGASLKIPFGAGELQEGL